MDEEKALNEARHWHSMKKIEETLNSLRKNNMEGLYVEDREAALGEILKRIPPNATVYPRGILHAARNWNQGNSAQGAIPLLEGEIPVSGGEEHDIQIKGFSSDVYLTSVNAITTAGELIALDGLGTGSHACFRPPQGIGGGREKQDRQQLDDGIRRLKEYVAPVHAKRRGWDLPCTKTGTCVDCRDPRRICNKLAVLQYERDRERTTVILVGEDLGI